jgi:hypothetical protein
MWFQHNRAGQAEDSQLGNLSGRIRKEDNAHAMLDRVTHITSDLESAKVKARSLFDTLNMPQNPDGLRILDQSGNEVFFWTPGIADS